MKTIASLTFLTFSFCAALLDTAWAQPLTVTTVAGQFGVAGYTNGVGLNSDFLGYPESMAADSSGNLYVLDGYSVRKIATDGTVTTFAGQIKYGGYNDGPNADALFSFVADDGYNGGVASDIAVDAQGNIYIADTGNYDIRKISSGMVTTLAGNPYAVGHVDGTNGDALFEFPQAITVDSKGNVYVADGDFAGGNTSIRKITPAGVVTTIAGGGPSAGYNDGQGTNAQFFAVSGLAVDSGGTIYVADGWGIRKISPFGLVTTWVGSPPIGPSAYEEADGLGANAWFAEHAFKIALDGTGGAYVTDSDTIRYVSSDGVVSTVAGVAGENATTSNNGVGSDARFGNAFGIAVDAARNVYISDAGEYTILKGVPPSLPAIGSFSESPGGTPVRSNNPWQFTVFNYSTIVSDLRLRVQSTATTNDASSWTDLPGNPDMTDNNGDWTLNTMDVPVGTLYFRVVAAAPGYFDSASAAVGPETVLPPPQVSPVSLYSYSTGGTPVRSSNPWEFYAYDSDSTPELKLRVQSTTTTNDPGSWQDLPGSAGAYMTNQNGTWTLQKTDVPTGTQYFRVVGSAPGYLDYESAAVGPVTVLQGFDPWGYFSYATTVPYSTATPWSFVITQPSQISGMSLRMQSTTTPADPNSWTDLPGGGQMTRLFDAINDWAIYTTNLPVGATVSFRVIASASDYVDLVSVELGPFEIRPPPNVHSTTVSEGGAFTLQDFNPLAGLINVIHVIGNAVVHLFHNGDTSPQGTQNLDAENGSSVDLTISKGQVFNGNANLGSNAGLIVSGTVDGDVTQSGKLIGQDGSGALSHDSASLAQIAAGIIAAGGGNIVAAGGGNIVAAGGGNIVAAGGGNIVSAGGGNVANGPAIEKALSALKRKKSNGPIQPADNTQPSFTGQMIINGDYDQFSGSLVIAIAGTNTLNGGAQQYDQLVVSGTANLLGGAIAFGLFNPDNQTNQDNVFQPPDGATFDVVVASNIVVDTVAFIGPIWGDGQFFAGSVVTRDDGLQAVRLTAIHVPPRVGLMNAGSNLELFYAINYTGYAVESSPDLINWSTYSTGTNVVELSPGNVGQFFRLHKP